MLDEICPLLGDLNDFVLQTSKDSDHKIHPISVRKHLEVTRKMIQSLISFESIIELSQDEVKVFIKEQTKVLMSLREALGKEYFTRLLQTVEVGTFSKELEEKEEAASKEMSKQAQKEIEKFFNSIKPDVSKFNLLMNDF